MIERAKKFGKLQSWFDVDASIVENLDPLLEMYEEQCRAGLRPDPRPMLDMCPDDEHRQLLLRELDHYRDFYPQTLSAAVGNTKREEFQRVESEVPQTIGEYRILQTLGRGGFGVVLCAEHMQTKKRVALKVPHPGWQSRESFESLVREANALSTLHHEGIVRFYESKATPDGNWIISTEWIDGRNLEEIGKSESLSIERVTEIVLELLAALGYAHKRGIVHRDIKPSNVMIEKSGRVKLLDFGMAKIFDDPGFSQSGQLKGSIAYMSPEQASGDVHETNERSDIYGVGVLLYELLAGRRPFVGREDDVRRAIVNEQCPPLKEFAPHIPETLAFICHKALAKDQANRFQSAQEFSAALLDWKAGKAVSGLETVSCELERRQETIANVGQPDKSLSPSSPRSLTRSLLMQVFLAVALSLLIVAGISFFDDGIRVADSNDSAATQLINSNPLFPIPFNSALTTAQNDSIYWGNYDQLDARPVSLETDPPGAKVTFFPLGNELAPNRTKAVVVEANKVNVELQPGNYLVVAELENGNFSEVNRYVPLENELPYKDFRHATWVMKGEIIQLPTVEILPLDSSAMIACGQALIDRDLVSEASFMSVTNPTGKKADEFGLEPMSGIDHDAALAYCELIGRRLPTVAELTTSYQTDKIHTRPDFQEWTSTGERNVYGKSINAMYATWRPGKNKIPTEELVVRSFLGFRTARSLRPLTPLASE